MVQCLIARICLDGVFGNDRSQVCPLAGPFVTSIEFLVGGSVSVVGTVRPSAFGRLLGGMAGGRVFRGTRP
jgi:hypothetical protein